MEETIREGVRRDGYDWKIAYYIATRLDDKYGREWHCVISKVWSSYVGNTLSYYSAIVEGYYFRVFRTLRNILDSSPTVEVVKLTTSDSRNEVNIKTFLFCFVIEVFRSSWH